MIVFANISMDNKKSQRRQRWQRILFLDFSEATKAIGNARMICALFYVYGKLFMAMFFLRHDVHFNSPLIERILQRS